MTPDTIAIEDYFGTYECDASVLYAPMTCAKVRGSGSDVRDVVLGPCSQVGGDSERSERCKSIRTDYRQIVSLCLFAGPTFAKLGVAYERAIASGASSSDGVSDSDLSKAFEKHIAGPIKQMAGPKDSKSKKWKSIDELIGADSDSDSDSGGAASGGAATSTAVGVGGSTAAGSDPTPSRHIEPIGTSGYCPRVTGDFMRDRLERERLAKLSQGPVRAATAQRRDFSGGVHSRSRDIGYCRASGLSGRARELEL
jgi:hypothetical protein